VNIRAATADDDAAIWAILEPTFRAGETYPIPRDISRADALAYWRASAHDVFVAEHSGAIVGTYYLRANNRGGGSHVANCGYVVAENAFGRGVARAIRWTKRANGPSPRCSSIL
jgi:predicted N-acetyltransferase YhbS